MMQHVILTIVMALTAVGCATPVANARYEGACTRIVQSFDSLSPEEQNWSLENDVNADGHRFTCEGYTAAIWVRPVITNLMRAVRENNAAYLEPLISRDVWIRGDEQNGGVATRTSDPEEVLSALLWQQELFGVRWSDCLSIEDVMISSGRGLAIGPGSIWIYADGQELYLTTINLSESSEIDRSDFCH